jgi:hypothetical protein
MVWMPSAEAPPGMLNTVENVNDFQTSTTSFDDDDFQSSTKTFDDDDFQTSTTTSFDQPDQSTSDAAGLISVKEGSYVRSVKCGECNFVSKSPRDLQQHRAANHKVPNLKCATCHFTASSPVGIMQHYYDNHSAALTSSQTNKIVECREKHDN